MEIASRAAREDEGFELEPIGPGKYAIRPARPTVGKIRNHIGALRGWASDMIKHGGRDPVRYYEILVDRRAPLDRAFFGARMLRTLNFVEGELSTIEQGHFQPPILE
jgi:hypothetical protein